MRLLVRLILLVIFGPIILAMLLVLGVVAFVGLPLLWEEAVARFTAPPPEQGPTGALDA
ncbi:MAG: hypothetical protein NVS2B16_32610 [Chloroflexota bacterium]